MSQRCEREDDDSVLLAEIQQIPRRKIRIGFDLHDGRFCPIRAGETGHSAWIDW